MTSDCHHRLVAMRKINVGLEAGIRSLLYDEQGGGDDGSGWPCIGSETETESRC